jgi:glycosyltransferase involved in cell wall biosynthesis
MAPGVPTDAIVYTPHCFAFERRDLNPVVRTSYHTIERVLFRRAAAVAACSPREAELARRLGRRAPTRVRYVPNVFRPSAGAARSVSSRGGLRVVGQGRLNLQKDPAFFRRVATAVHAVDPTVEFTWIGGDPESEVEAMRAVGVETTGWVPRHVVLEHLAEAQVYLHTASWEGAPVALLEAAASGLAVVARDIPAMSALDVPLRRSTPEELAELILGLRDPSTLAQARRSTASWLAVHDPQEQVAALNGVYLEVTRQTVVPLPTASRRRGAEPVGRR